LAYIRIIAVGMDNKIGNTLIKYLRDPENLVALRKKEEKKTEEEDK